MSTTTREATRPDAAVVTSTAPGRRSRFVASGGPTYLLLVVPPAEWDAAEPLPADRIGHLRAQPLEAHPVAVLQEHQPQIRLQRDRRPPQRRMEEPPIRLEEPRIIQHRIHRSELQDRLFAAIGMSKEETQYQFGHLLEAFQYGAPPHGGIALGIAKTLAYRGTAYPSIREMAYGWPDLRRAPWLVDEPDRR